MSNKITIIGSGSVGATIAYTMTVTGLAAEIVMIDINVEKSLGEALDIRQGTPFCDPVSIYAGSYADAVGSDIVVITSGVARKPGQTRLELAQKNVDIMKSVIPQISKYAPDAIYVLVANPVDILTYQFYKYSDIPNNHILGSGTLLDTARLRARLAEYYSLSQKSVHAYVFGEHGDSSFVPWSLANISNIPIDDYKDALSNKEQIVPDLDHAEVEKYIRTSGGKIIARKGATFFAVAISVTHLCRSILSGSDSAMSVSTMMNGEYGIDDVCLSTLNIVGRNGVEGKLEAPLTEEEVKSLQHSANCLKEVISSLDFE
ncbi:MAG: L-lactate dehydrogenase [Sphaerochaetaceae bacterium]|nr:L-lactate dehydrogenase [Sphaerochaetaceae bacterium]